MSAIHVCMASGISLFALGSLGVQVDDPVSLKLKLQDSAKVYVEFEEVSWPKPSEDYEGPTIRNDTIHGFIEAVHCREDGGVEVALLLERVKFGSKRGEQGYMWDSDDAEEGSRALRDAFGPAIGQTLTFQLTAERDVKSLTGLSEMVEGMRKSVGENSFGSWVISSYTPEEMIRGFMHSRFALFPGTEVRIGDAWKAAHMTPPNQGSMRKEYECTLERVEEKDGRTIAVVGFTSKVVPGTRDKLAYEVLVSKMTSEGSAWIDVELGRIVSLTEETVMVFDPESASDGGASSAIVHRSFRVLSVDERVRRHESD